MSSDVRPLPGFKTLCTVVSGMYVLLGGSMLVRGARTAMTPFAVPEQVLSSAHFADFFHWVFVHMVVLGVMIGMLGRFVADGRHQLAVVRVLCLVELHYTYLDFRTSDSLLGNALYKGPGSLVPPIIDVVVTLCFAYLSVRGLPRKQAARAA